MSLARVKTWIAAEILTAADLNGEFNNILNNPISLISPTTGVISFSTLQTFPTDQLSSAQSITVTATMVTSGTIAAGGTLFFSTAATPLLDTLAIGTSGQVLTVSTDLKPSWAAAAAAVTTKWVNFDGNTSTVRASSGVASVSAPATGTYIVTWSVAFASANYAISGASGESGSLNYFRIGSTAGSLLAGSARVETPNQNGTPTNCDTVTVMAIGA